jgi:hypothetical protein
MKSLLTSALLVVLLTTCLSAQDTIRIATKGVYANNQVVLRWAPQDIDSWRYSNANGYSLERKTLRSGGQLLPTAEFQASLVLLSPSLIALPESQWESMADSSDLAGIAAGSIYGDSLDLLPPEGGGLLQIYNKAREVENRFGFSLFAADQDLKIAKAMGLAFVDTSVQAGKTYVYLVKALGTVVTEGGFTSVNTDSAAITTAPSGLQAAPADKSVILQWNKDETMFTSFVVERAVGAGGAFVPLNTSPLMFASTTGDAAEPMSYVDSLADNNTLYVYRVRGKTPFGVLSAASDTIHVTGKPGPLPFLMSIREIEEVNEGALTINWDFPAVMEAQMSGFDLYRSDRVDGVFTKLNTSPIGMSLRTFEDLQPLPGNYYVIKTTDLNGYEYRTFPYMAQPKDDTPPTTPTLLTAECSKSGVVTLTWAKNNEPDVMGYRVFMSNAIAGDYAQVTSTWINDTVYHYQVGSNTLSEEVHFAIKALDQRQNQSPMSQPMTVMRPDIIPPSPPIIKTAIASTTGVKFEWDLSSSTDVVSYTLERKEVGMPEWVSVLDFNVNNPALAHLDAGASARKSYEYRLLAIDDEGLKSSSKIIKTKPVDSGLRGAIQNFVGQLTPNPKSIILQWDYPNDPDLVGFEVFRALNDVNKQRSYDFVKIPTGPTSVGSNNSNAVLNGNSWHCIFGDKNLKFDLTHMNKFVMVPSQNTIPNTAVLPPVPPAQGANTNGLNFVVPNPNNLAGQQNKIPTVIHYWVMAKYADGGYSTVAGPISIPFQ